MFCIFLIYELIILPFHIFRQRESRTETSSCSVECGQGEKNVTTVAYFPELRGDRYQCTEIRNTMTVVCFEEICPGKPLMNIIHRCQLVNSTCLTDNCIWETWSSCQYFCGTEKIPEKTRRQIADGHARNTNCNREEKEDCTLPCTGKLS